ncbi:hypothetical protein CEP10_05320 [Cylindrospermopsis raciborskii S07]|nr:conserved hypothetical protein [Cylindrospermopsis raciborskii CS-505]OHY38755.1 hypothetical protein BCV63_12745 [Cylindrospermopsis raciborskii CS-508]PNK07125.1 hypothetical protein CEP11_05295 [Cylindrospermopsis raciborskii S10]PNK09451.1 hypothetical protein CEP10_05320 [Cylindrospermopsis raciborskii S07]PNK11424.1 hypothetical protein CEP12_02100 [Cylindrospermopsis raciborskii S14]PNK13739.1 hypothetical protein CEP07_15165 [Cylindrospermopsis raciborskii S01]PNK18060.1 hypothetic
MNSKFPIKHISPLCTVFVLLTGTNLITVTPALGIYQHQIIAKQPIQGKKSQVNPVFQPILSKLKKTTQINILLPTHIPIGKNEPPLYSIVETVTKNKYQILLGFTPDCSGGTACRFGAISAELVSSNTPKPVGKEVNLNNNKKAYFEDFKCGANCSDANLTWREKGVQYTIGLKAGSLSDLVKMANSVVSANKRIRP